MDAQNSINIFSPFSVALTCFAVLLIYCKLTYFNKARWIILLLVFTAANMIFFLQYNHGVKNIGSWYENKNEYLARYYVDIYDPQTKAIVFNSIKADIRRPPVDPEDCIHTGGRYFVESCDRKVFIQKLYFPRQTVDYKSGFPIYSTSVRSPIILNGISYDIKITTRKVD